MKKNVLQKQRDYWWSELREEIKNNAIALECTHIIGYSESITFQKDVCILTEMGTAAIKKKINR